MRLRLVIIAVLQFFVCYDVQCYQIEGSVLEFLTEQPVANAYIYEEYNDKPVAITDSNGHFAYKTLNEATVNLYVIKSGYLFVSSSVDGHITEKSSKNIKFYVDKYWVSNKAVTFYSILDDDVDCILNLGFSLRHADCPKHIDKCYANNGKGLLWLLEPNPDTGGLVIPNITSHMTLHHVPLSGEVFFKPPKENVVYESVPLWLFEQYLDSRADFFELTKSLGYNKNINSREEYRQELKKEALKFCHKKKGQCSKQDLKTIRHATYGVYRADGKCCASQCDKGYYKYKCQCLTKNSQADMQDAISQLSDNAQAMKDKEQSFENRMLGGATMAATGIGGMMALFGLSEQKADTASEEDMRAYLATFACDYGNGQRVSGGTTGVELPGANDLIDKYTAYATLANSLKERKTALNLKPGLESEIVIDKATTGLYDDVGTGIGSGAYASISRALLNPDSEDAKKWNAQKEASAKKLKTGAIMAGAGVVMGVGGNYLINHKNKSKTQEILDKYNIKIADDVSKKTDLLLNETEPAYCSSKTCLDKLIISEKTTTTEIYNKAKTLCDMYYKNETDCYKVMLIFMERNTSDIDLLVANMYDFDYFKKELPFWCDENVCLKDGTSITNMIFDEMYYKMKEKIDKVKQLETSLKKCFKQAGALDYLDIKLPYYDYNSAFLEINIDFDKIDCTTLDTNKTNKEYIIYNSGVAKYLKDSVSLLQLREILKNLFGTYADFVK